MKKGKIAALVVVFAMLLGSMSSYAALWDGYVEPVSDEETATLVDMDNMTAITGCGLSVSQNVRGKARYSARWKDTKGKTWVQFNDVPRDWTKYSKLNLNIYSAKATNAGFMVLIYCDHVPNPGTSSSYFSTQITVDWTGWKSFSFDLEQDLSSYNGCKWNAVNYMAFTSSGWGLTPNAETDLYFDSITVDVDQSKGDVSKLMDSMYKESEKKTFREALGDGTAVWLFSGNVYKGNESKAIDANDYQAKPTTKDGVAMVPHKVFTDSIGATLTKDGGSYSLSYKGKKLSLKTGDTAATVDGESITLEGAPYLSGETLYLPALSCADALGMSAGMFDQLIVFGSDETIQKFADDPDLVELGGYMVSNRPLDVDSITAEDFAIARENWRRTLVGDENNDLTNSYVAQKVNSVGRSARSYQNIMKHDPDAAVLFGEKVVEMTTEMTQQYSKIYSMAIGYGTYGSETYRDPQLKEDILFALEWGYNHLYGPAEMAGTGWRSTALYDWWDWYVGTGQNLLKTLLILQPDISQETIDKYMEPFHFIRNSMRTQKNLAYAQTRIEVVTLAALLQDDASLMSECLYDFELNFHPTTSAEGGYEDGGYINHTCLPLVGMYGSEVQLRRVVGTASILAGTKFETTSSLKYKQMFWMKNTYEPLLHNGYMMAFVNGRSPGTGATYGKYVIQGALNLLGSFSEDDDLWLKQIVRRWVNEQNASSVISALSIEQIMKLQNILDDDTIPAWEETAKAHVYYSMDRVVSHQDGYSAGVAMHSSRIGHYESSNGCNKNGWFQGDGMLYIFRESDLSDPYGEIFWNNVNAYHLPGTTEDTQERNVTSYSGYYRPNRHFVGGVEMNGENAVAVMDFEAFHNDVAPKKTGQFEGNDWDIVNNDLTVKKSWFFFDDEVVALGADINSTTGFDVQTTVENHQLTKHVKQAISSEQMTKSETVEYTPVSAEAVGHDGNVPANVLDNNYETRWSYEGAENAWLTLDLGEVKQVGYAAIAQYGGVNGKQAIFKLALSEDGENWTEVFDGKASGQTDQLEAYDCKNTAARYVKYIGAGRTNSGWNSVTEFKVFAPRADGQILLPGVGDSNKVNDGTIYGAEEIRVDGSIVTNEGDIDTTKDNVTWAAVESLGGYYFPQGGNLTVYKENKQNPFVEMWLNHGANPKNETYAYALLPNYSATETATYAANPDIEILSNTNKVQAVRDKSTGLTGIVFWEAGSFGGITVSAPMALMIRETGNSYEIAVSDPTQKLGDDEKEVNETITIAKTMTLQSADRGVKAETSDSAATVKVNFGKSGKTYKVNFKTDANGSTSETPSGDNNAAGGGGTATTPAPTTSFADMKEAEWAAEYVAELADKGIVSGDENGNFRPNASITREEFVKLLVGALGIEIGEATESFSDVEADAWYAPYLAAAKAAGITTGNADGTFGVGAEITRQDMAVMANRALEKIGVTLEDGETTFDDNADIADYAMAAIGKMQKAGILNGNGNGGFAPLDSASRAQAAKIIVGLMNQIPTAEAE